MKGKLSAEAQTLLEAALAAPGATQETVAARMGYNRSTLSLALNGKYPGSTDKFSAKVIEALGRIVCPHLGEEISRQDCRAHHTRAAPTSSPFAMRHWRACQGCPHRRPA